jgi:hypothetical protein
MFLVGDKVKFLNDNSQGIIVEYLGMESYKVNFGNDIIDIVHNDNLRLEEENIMENKLDIKVNYRIMTDEEIRIAVRNSVMEIVKLERIKMPYSLNNRVENIIEICMNKPKKIDYISIDNSDFYYCPAIDGREVRLTLEQFKQIQDYKI